MQLGLYLGHQQAFSIIYNVNTQIEVCPYLRRAFCILDINLFVLSKGIVPTMILLRHASANSTKRPPIFLVGALPPPEDIKIRELNAPDIAICWKSSASSLHLIDISRCGAQAV